jgi:hypothetical protein
MKKHLTLKNFIVFVLLNTIVIVAVICGVELFTNSKKLKAYKVDYFNVNQIKYGLLDAQNWTNQVNSIIEEKVNSFTLTQENEAVLREELNKIFNKLFDEVDVVLHEKQKTAQRKIKYAILNGLVDIDNFRKDIPRFSNTIISEIEKSKNKDKVKEMLAEKVSNVLYSVSDSLLTVKELTLKRYGCANVEVFNKKIVYYNFYLEEQQQQYGYVLIFLMISILLLWIILIKYKILTTLAFVYSVLLSFVNLFIGINLPMIEIDARIAQLNLHLLDSHILFSDQVIFYQSKSILDVVSILFKAGHLDSVFVAVLIFIFSVIFPMSKLICSAVYLVLKDKANALVKYMAFKSGKWSMADVMVVAIFMAYVGFQGILNSQLDNIQLAKESVNLVTTNKSSMQIGFLIFVSFVLCNLILSEVLKRITETGKPSFKQMYFDLIKKRRAEKNNL